MMIPGRLEPRAWALRAALATLVLCLAAEVGAGVRLGYAPSAQHPRAALWELSDRLDRHPHECVPLGWYPAGASWGGVYPEYNADVAAVSGLFRSQWVALFRPGPLPPEAVAVRDLLEELARAGMLNRVPSSDGMRYTLTHEGQRYYYERDDLGNNVENWPYLCFSALRTTRIAWAGPSVKKSSRYVSRRLRFTWTAEPDAPWVTPIVREHAVELAPISSPAEVEASRYADGRWHLTSMPFQFPLIKHRAAWIAGTKRPTKERS